LFSLFSDKSNICVSSSKSKHKHVIDGGVY